MSAATCRNQATRAESNSPEFGEHEIITLEKKERMGIFWNNAERKPLEQKMKQEGRLPPGQSLTLKWPVLHYADVPRFDPENWEFRTSGLVDAPLRLSWNEFLKLPTVQVTSDFHCVTRWSRFDNHWEGVSFRTICDLTRPAAEAKYVMTHAAEGYATNVPLKDLLADDVLFALKHDGEALLPDHGGPLRLIVPKLYGWKSAKWVQGLEFLAQDRAGFWNKTATTCKATRSGNRDSRKTEVRNEKLEVRIRISRSCAT